MRFIPKSGEGCVPAAGKNLPLHQPLRLRSGAGWTRRMSGVVLSAIVLLTATLRHQALAQALPRQSSGQGQKAIDAETINLSATPEAETLPGGKTSVVLGLIANAAPAYDGARNTRVEPFPYVDIHGWFHDRVFLSSISGLGVNLIDDGPFKSGLALNYDFGRKSSDSDRLTGLPDIAGAPMVVGFITYAPKPLSFELKVENEFGSNPGTVVSLGSAYEFAPTPRLHLSIGSQLSWNNRQYNRSRFGVTPAEASQATAEGNTMDTYDPGAGISDVRITATGIYQFSRHWGMASRLAVNDLVGAQGRNSPLTERSVGESIAIGGFYRF